MEFDEMQKIWNSQTNEPLWAINESALFKRIMAKKRTSHHISNFSEILLIVVNLAAGVVIAGLNFFKPPVNFFLYAMVAWMFATAIYVMLNRFARVKETEKFDRSMLGELGHALSNAKYQVRLSNLMRWNILLIGALVAMSFWQNGKSILLIFGIMLGFVVVFFASGWEHGIYVGRKRELEALKGKLAKE